MQEQQETHRHAAIVKLTEEDPTNGHEPGTIMITDGKCEDGVARSVFTDDGIIDIECEVLDVFEANTPMERPDLLRWAHGKAKESDNDYTESQ